MGSEKPASKRRRYSEEQKLQVLAECDAGGASTAPKKPSSSPRWITFTLAQWVSITLALKGEPVHVQTFIAK